MSTPLRTTRRSTPTSTSDEASRPCCSPELRIRSGEQVVQPVEGGGPEDDGCHAFAVSFCAFGFGEQPEFFGAGQPVEQHLSLAEARPMQYRRRRCGDGVEIHSFPTHVVPRTEQPSCVP